MKLQPRESRLNAYKHGLTAQTLILDPADKPAYDEHCKSYFDLYKPVNRPEQLLVQMIADDYWRCLRGRAIETSLMSRVLEFNAELKIDPAEERMLNNLSIYIQRIERSIRNNTKALKEMQVGRPADSRQPAVTPAKNAPELVFSPGETPLLTPHQNTPPPPQSDHPQHPQTMTAA